MLTYNLDGDEGTKDERRAGERVKSAGREEAGMWGGGGGGCGGRHGERTGGSIDRSIDGVPSIGNTPLPIASWLVNAPRGEMNEEGRRESSGAAGGSTSVQKERQSEKERGEKRAPRGPSLHNYLICRSDPPTC